MYNGRMSLTENDISAIKTVVEEAVNDSDLRTAAAFAEAHDKMGGMDKNLSEKIAEVNDKLSIKDGELENTVQRVDTLEVNVKNLQLKSI